MTETSVLMNLFGNGSNFEIGLDGVDEGIGMSSHEEGGEANEASNFKYGFRLSFGDSVNEDDSLIFPNVHDHVISAKPVDGFEDGEWVSFRSRGEDELKEALWHLINLTDRLRRVPDKVP